MSSSAPLRRKRRPCGVSTLPATALFPPPNMLKRGRYCSAICQDGTPAAGWVDLLFIAHEQACEGGTGGICWQQDLERRTGAGAQGPGYAAVPKATSIAEDVAVRPIPRWKLRCSLGAKRMTLREIRHSHAAQHVEPRAPAAGPASQLWAEIATRADNEGWPAARFLAVLAEYELAERTCAASAAI